MLEWAHGKTTYTGTASGGGSYTVRVTEPQGGIVSNKRTEILETAIELTNGDRQDTYGDPIDNMTRVAKRWSVTLGFEIKPWQVAVMMVDLKIDRLAHSPTHKDSAIDGAAYFAIASEVAGDSPPEQDSRLDAMLEGAPEGFRGSSLALT